MMRLLLLVFLLIPSLAAASGDDDSAPPEAVDPGPGTVVVVDFDDIMINRGSQAYFLESLEAAQKNPDVRALVLVMDTPGGALDATREIVKAELASELPILVYVSPTGSRAASAGVFITMAAHVAVNSGGDVVPKVVFQRSKAIRRSSTVATASV